MFNLQPETWWMSDITGGNLSAYMQPHLEPQKMKYLFFHMCNSWSPHPPVTPLSILGTLTLAALGVTFSVTTMENSLGKRSQLTSSSEEGKLMEVWGLDKCIPLTAPACFMCTPGTSLEGSLSRTKDRRSRGSRSEDMKRSENLIYWSRLFMQKPFSPILGSREVTKYI